MSDTSSPIPTTTLTDKDFTVTKAVKIRVFRHQQRPGRNGLDYFVVFTCATPGVITNDRIMYLVGAKSDLDAFNIGDTYTVDVYTSKSFIQKYDNFVKV